MYDPNILARNRAPGTQPAGTPQEHYVVEHPSGNDLLVMDVYIIRHIATTTGVKIVAVHKNGIIIEATAADAIGFERRLWQALPNIRVRLLASNRESWDTRDIDPDNPDA